MYTQMSRPAKNVPTSTTPTITTSQLDPTTQSTLVQMQNQIKSLQQQLDKLKTTVQPLLPLAEAMQKYSSELQSAKESIGSFTRMLGEVVPTIQHANQLTLFPSREKM